MVIATSFTWIISLSDTAFKFDNGVNIGVMLEHTLNHSV
jgi:hypothetical protein